MDEWNKLGGKIIDDKMDYYLLKRSEYNDIVDLERKKYSDVLSLYDIFIDEIANFIHNLSLYNSLDISIALGMLIKMGVFSYNRNFLIDNNGDVLKSKKGMQIIIGEGLSNNFSSFQKDIFDYMNIFNELYYCNANNRLTSEDIIGKSAHVGNIIIYKNKQYIYDSLNDLFLPFIKTNVAKSIDKDIYLYYKPTFSISEDLYKKEDVIALLNIFKESISNHIDIDEYNEIHKETTQKLISKIKDIKDFKKETNTIKEKILSRVI